MGWPSPQPAPFKAPSPRLGFPWPVNVSSATPCRPTEPPEAKVCALLGNFSLLSGPHSLD